MESSAYPGALEPRKGNLRSASLCPCASTVSTMAATPTVEVMPGHMVIGRIRARYLPLPAFVAKTSQFLLAPATP